MILSDRIRTTDEMDLCQKCGWPLEVGDSCAYVTERYGRCNNPLDDGILAGPFCSKECAKQSRP